MREPSGVSGRLLILTAAFMASVLPPALGPVEVRADAPDPSQGQNGRSCPADCRGLGIEKVKAGDEHCGLISRERKDEALDAACGLARSHREELQRLAEERARETCDADRLQPGCACETELRDWQNVYTHVFSKRCWAECGWAFLIRCEREAEPDGDDDPGSPDTPRSPR